MASLRTIVALPIKHLVIDPSLQMRANGLNAEHVADIREAIQEGKTIPRIKVTLYESKYLVTEGFHRVEAFKQEGKAKIPAEVRPGTWEDAVETAAAANSEHTGIKRSGADKRKAVRELAALHEDWSLRKVADHCGVSHHLVRTVKAEFGVVHPEDEDSTSEIPASPSQNDDCVAKTDSSAVINYTDQNGDDSPETAFVAFDHEAYRTALTALKGQAYLLAKSFGQITLDGHYRAGNAQGERLEAKLAEWDTDFQAYEKVLKKNHRSML